MLCVYPEGDLLERCVARYDGDVLLFVGEGRGGGQRRAEAVRRAGARVEGRADRGGAAVQGGLREVMGAEAAAS